jgi:hypothetical protein
MPRSELRCRIKKIYLFSISIYFSKMACVVSYGAELYRVEAKNEETLRKSGHGTPNAWMGWNVYAAR